MLTCQRCGAPLSRDEIGLHMKILDRCAESYFCMRCLANVLDCSTDVLERKILQFRAQGCVLFPEPSEDEL